MDRASVSSDYAHFSELAFVLVRDPVAAEVIAVDAVLAAIRKSVAPDAPPGIHRAKRKLAHQAMGYMRRRRWSRMLPWTKEQPDGVDIPEATRKVWNALAALSRRQQVAVVMARLDGANLSEVADILDCSSAAANTHLDRARKGLAERLGDDVDLRLLLTKELRAIAQAFAREHRPDPAPVEQAIARAGRWRVWGLAIGVTGAALAVLVVNLLRG